MTTDFSLFQFSPRSLDKYKAARPLWQIISLIIYQLFIDYLLFSVISD